MTVEKYFNQNQKQTIRFIRIFGTWKLICSAAMAAFIFTIWTTIDIHPSPQPFRTSRKWNRHILEGATSSIQMLLLAFRPCTSFCLSLLKHAQRNSLHCLMVFGIIYLFNANVMYLFWGDAWRETYWKDTHILKMCLILFYNIFLQGSHRVSVHLCCIAAERLLRKKKFLTQEKL